MNSSSNMATSFQHSSDGANVWQPVMMAPVNKDERKSKYPGMQYLVINVFSTFCIILGIASIGVQIAALVIYATELYNYVWFGADVVGHGIWAGSFYVMAGSLGIAAAYKRTKSLLVWTVVLSGLSIASAITASTLAGIAASAGIYCSFDLCDVWLALEWCLMGISILASISSIILIVVVSVPLCCSSRKNKNAGNQQGFHFVAGQQQQQPMYFHSQQPMMLMQQQYQPNFQASNVPLQQFQQQPQMPFVTAYPTTPYTQAQQQTPVSVPQQQQKPSGSEAVEVKVQTTE